MTTRKRKKPCRNRKGKFIKCSTGRRAKKRTRKVRFAGGFTLSGQGCRDKSGEFVPVFPNCSQAAPKKKGR